MISPDIELPPAALLAAPALPLQAFSPVSIGNFIAGFDVLGAAVQPVDGTRLGDVVTVEAGDGLGITGPYASALPADPQANIVARARTWFEQTLLSRELSPRPLRLALEKRLPVGSGLGSSGSSIVAALVALNAAHGEPLDAMDLLRLAGGLEGEISGGVHYDNVAPSLLGGLQLMAPAPAPPAVALPFFPEWRFVLYYPGFVVSTRDARRVLPAAWPLGQLTHFGQRIAGLVHGLHVGDRELVARLLVDDLIEPHRAALVPGLPAAQRAAREAGALACGLSGSGPTTVAVAADDLTAQRVLAALAGAFEPRPGAFGHVCAIEPQGAVAMPA